MNRVTWSKLVLRYTYQRLETRLEPRAQMMKQCFVIWAPFGPHFLPFLYHAAEFLLL